MNKIVFYQERTFGDKFNVTFEFIKPKLEADATLFCLCCFAIEFCS